MIRQGDLLFVKCDCIPEGSVEQSDGVIARGESTGHAHRIADHKQALLMLCAGVMYVKALRDTQIKHEEHHEVILPAGDWIVRRQREYQPDGWKQVAD